jgi:dipeptidyl aminopeptidase/acylaminoacyl peptidase
MNTPRRCVTALALVIFFLLPSGGHAQTRRPMTLVDQINIPWVADARLSPDGMQILFTQDHADWKANKRVAHIFRIGADGQGYLQLTQGENGESSPRWSPDGRTIAFLAKRGSVEETQIFLMPTSGGEGRRLSRHATSVSSIAWALDGASIYFIAADPKTDDERQKDTLKDDVYAFDETHKQQHLWRVDVKSGEEQRITSGDFSVAGYRLSRDGRRIAHHRGPTPMYGDAEKGEVWLMDADGGNARQLTKNGVAEGGAEISPDGSQILFVAAANERFDTYYNGNLFLVPAAGGQARPLIADFPYEVTAASWAKDGRAIYVVANMGVHSELFRLDLVPGAKPAQLTKGEHAIIGGEYGPGPDRWVLQLDEATRPGEIWTLAMPGGGTAAGAPQRVTKVFEYLERDFDLPRIEAVQWKGADGVTVEGLLSYPLNYQKGTRYPLCVQTHGGPMATDKFGMGGALNYIPVLAAKGYAVFRPNYRGSTGYGNAFLRDMVGHYFQNAHLDVMTGVDHLIELGIADADRMVKMGWSGGGHMTSWIVTFTDRFKAAASGAGASNWISMYAQSDVRTYRTPWFGGTPWQTNAPIPAYWEHSPIAHAAKVKTPTIFLVGENDVRVPPQQSVEMYRALRANGVPTHLYLAPREPHIFGELRHVLFKSNVELDWFEKHATRRTYVWEKAPVEGAQR